MIDLNIYFYECEHNGDLDNYKEDVRASGGDILNSGLDYEAETGWLKVRVEDKEAFMKKFAETDAYDFMT